MSRWLFVSLAVFAALMADCLLGQGLGGAFIFDDLPNIVDNSRLHLASLDLDKLWRASRSYDPGGGSRPLAMLSFALDYWRAGGLEPAVFRQTNLLIHGLTVVAVAALLRQLLLAARWNPSRAATGALLLALFWGVHPLQVSSVLYVVQRMQTLGTLFTVLGLLAYLHARRAQMSGTRSLVFWGACILSGLVGFACKEDVVLLPLYMLVLEITVLKFAAADARTARWMRGAYLGLAGLGGVLFLLVLVPHYWHWDAYPGRNFSSSERLLTQSRVLMLYLAQIILPIPAQLPFYYDGLPVSHGLLDPPTTLASLVALLAMAWGAWAYRHVRPAMAAGLFLFLAGHVVTSNVLNLELAFEHRNHFPLMGALLACADGLCWLTDRFKVRRLFVGLLMSAVLAVMCLLTFLRASAWGNPFQFALQGPDYAPTSVRAWQLACKNYFERSGGDPEHPFFDFAIQSCEQGAALPGGMLALSDVIVLKTAKGVDVDEDWAQFQRRIKTDLITPEGRMVIESMMRNGARGVPLDGRQMAQAIDSFSQRTPLSPIEMANVAEFLLTHADRPDTAYLYYRRAIDASGPQDPLPALIYADLASRGKEEWVTQLKQRSPP